MDTNVTSRRIRRLIAGFALLSEIALGQVLPAASQVARDVAVWRKLGNDSVGLNLAGPVGGPVDSAWFAPAGDSLFVRTHSGQVLETGDFANWHVSTSPTIVSPLPEIGLSSNVRSPESGARIVMGGGRLYSLGVNLQVSYDFGSTWSNLTAFNGEPIIGGHQHSVAISPLDPRQIVVANDFGVWRTTDGGLSWTGLNEELPNLPMRHLLPSPVPGTMRAEVEGIGVVELPPAAAAAHANWIRASDSGAGLPDPLDAQRKDASKILGTEITALGRTATTWFAGSIDGRLWTSFDSGKTWLPSTRAAGRIVAIQTGGQNPGETTHSALAVALSPVAPGISGPRLLRTTNDGGSWEDLSAGLPDGALHGVAVDAVAGVAYIAADRGVFTAHVDMNNLVPVSQWQQVPGLPDAPAMDVRLDPIRNILYVALNGYGLYAAPAPHKSAAIRVLTAADQPAESAAPGVLLHVQGSGLSRVRSESGDLPLVTASASSTQVQVPFEASGSTLALTVDSVQGASRFALPLRAVAPAILVDGDGLPILVDATSGLTLDARNMARPGARIQVFAAGLGKVNPEWRAGIPAPPALEDAPVVTAQVEARLNGTPVEVTRATLAPGYVGLYLVEVQLPGLVDAGAADFALVVNGETSNRVKILLTVN
jgi:uncharacterized protein (TIGR03437 family)